MRSPRYGGSCDQEGAREGGREGGRAENGERGSKVERGAVGVGVAVVVVMVVVEFVMVVVVVVVVVVAVALLMLVLVMTVVAVMVVVAVLVAVSEGFFRRAPGYSRSPLSVYFVCVNRQYARMFSHSGCECLVQDDGPQNQHS